jgi:uncharacterized protein YqcC (DUF446 family)
MPDQSPAVPAEAVQVLTSFLAAADRKDEAGMKACLSRKTLESGTFNNAGPEDMNLVMGEATLEGDMVVIPLRGTPKGAPADAPAVMELPCLIVKEDGQWKFDLSSSVDRMMGGSLQNIVETLGTAMAGAMEGIGKAMSEGLSQAFGESAPAAATDQPALTSDAASSDDVYKRADYCMIKLEQVMRTVGLWPGDKPEGPIEVKGAFGCENMAFTQWLAWVLIPRVTEIIAEHGPFPEGSAVAAYCIRELDGQPGGEQVHDVLSDFDNLINNIQR